MTTPHYDLLPASMKEVISLIVKELDPKEVVLFGSRARGDHRETSDFDIAVKASSAPASAWNKLHVALDEEPLTLYRLDLLNFDQVSAAYQSRILAEGKPLYVR